ncbi:hypothetical protein [Pseudonocardia alni]|uniref:hypothetical protein n=1 Tax=Pseudonocardia alni TaxID=33907 RepID=UPI0033F87055
MRGRATLAGTREYLGSVLVGVVLAPVLPDVAVDLFGDGTVRDPLLRLGAVAAVLAGCVLLFRWRRARTARRAARSGLTLTNLERRDVLIAPIGLRSGYTERDNRTGVKTVVEWLVDSSRPDTVIGVCTPQSATVLPALRAGLAADGVRLETAELSDVLDPEATVATAQALVVGLVDARGLRERSTYVDITGGTVPMSLAMLRVGAVLGARCTYVSSEFRGGTVVPGTQRASAFDPAALAAVR